MNQKAVQLSGLVIFGVVAAAGALMVFLADRSQSSGPPRTVSYTDTVALVEAAMARAGDDLPDGITLHSATSNGAGAEVDYAVDHFVEGDDARSDFRRARRAEVRAYYCDGGQLEDATEYMNVEYGWYDPDDRVITGFFVRGLC